MNTRKIDVSKLTITEIDQMTTFNNAGELEFIMDEMSDATISNTEEKVDITGKGGRKIGSLKKNKAVKVTGTNGLLVGGGLAAQTGSDIGEGEYAVRATDVIVVKTGKGATTDEAIGTAGAEIGILYRKNANGSLNKIDALKQVAAEPKTGEFTYVPDTKAITFFAGDVVDGEELVAFYDKTVTSAKISNDSETYSKTLKMYLDVTCQDNCDNVYHGQFIIQRADFSGSFDLQFGGEPSTHAFEAESLAGGCSGSTALWDFIVY